MYNLCPNGVKTRFIKLIETNHHRFECGASIMALLLLYTNQSLIAKYTYMYCCTIKTLNMFEWKKSIKFTQSTHLLLQAHWFLECH